MPHPPRREPSPIQVGPNKKRAPKTTSNLVTAWWDASQIYGHDELSRKRVRWDPHDPARLLVIEGDLPFLQKCESCYDCLGHPDGSVVDNIEDVDNIVGWLAEYTRPHGFAISETQFHIFIINASRRLFSDRFFTSSFRPGFYSRLGYDRVIHNGPLSECPYPLTSLADGTEANNLAVRGVAHSLRDKGRHLITSAVEHPAVLQPCKRLTADGWKISIIPVDRYGQVNPEDIVNAIRSDTVLVSVMHANNEVGTIQPIEEIAAATQRHGIRLHTDAAQSIGKIPVNVDLLGVDLLSLAGHKFYATKGVGALYVREGTPVNPVLVGAGHERGLRPGTENVPAIVGLGKAAELAMKHDRADAAHLLELREQLHKLLEQGIPGLELNGHRSQRLPNTLNLKGSDK